MMDCVVIGGGLAGLTCGIRCAEAGLKTIVITAGMSALHFASGSIDLLGRFPGNALVRNPFDRLPDFRKQHPQHPYALCGEETVAASLAFFAEQLQTRSLRLCNNGNANHFHLTTYGTLTPTYLSQQSVYSPELEKAFFSASCMALISFEGFRDFHIPLIEAHLPRQTLFRNRQHITGTVSLRPLIRSGKDPHEFRSIDISRMFETEETLLEIAGQIKRLAGNAEIIGLPACVGYTGHNRVFDRLRELSGRLIYEIPTLPPSILGMRLDHALKSRFSDLGGVLIEGDKVIGGEFEKGRLLGIRTRNHEFTLLEARQFVLAGGSFFSGGLSSAYTGMREPVFDLRLSYEKERRKWAGNLFFQPESHAFLAFGVETNERLNPYGADGRSIDNLYCAGAVLSGYNPIREGSGGGVAISTGYFAAEQILAAGKGAGIV